MLRPYQQKAIDDLYDWFRHNEGNPCLVLPTGAGKSHIVAALCKDALQTWPDTRILMLTHQKELIEQNAEKLREHWRNAPMGIYSASLNRKCLSEPITFAGIQSVRTRSAEIGHIDLCIIDECHLVSHKDEGSYRTLLTTLKQTNPSLRVIGLTATPFRMGHGLITDKPALFDALIEPVSIIELIEMGFLAPLKSKVTAMQYDTSTVHKRGGDFIESELQAAVDTYDQNERVVREVIALSKNRKSWLFFCAGVAHSEHIAELLREHGIIAESVTGNTSKTERARMLREFKAGTIQALTNANVLTTGFDAPCVDLIAQLRPTMSASLYMQMCGRGLRIAPGKTDCLVLDFAGVVSKHGPITCVQPPRKSGENGDPPLKPCPECHEILHISAQICPECGHQFPPPKPKEYVLHTDCIMGGASDLMVSSWVWRKHTSKQSGKDMLAVTYYGALSDAPITEYIVVLHDGYAGQKARQRLFDIASSACVVEGGLNTDSLDEMSDNLNAARPPEMIEHRKNGKFNEVLRRVW